MSVYIEWKKVIIVKGLGKPVIPNVIGFGNIFETFFLILLYLGFIVWELFPKILN